MVNHIEKPMRSHGITDLGSQRRTPFRIGSFGEIDNGQVRVVH